MDRYLRVHDERVLKTTDSRQRATEKSKAAFPLTQSNGHAGKRAHPAAETFPLARPNAQEMW